MRAALIPFAVAISLVLPRWTPLEGQEGRDGKRLFSVSFVSSVVIQHIA